MQERIRHPRGKRANIICAVLSIIMMVILVLFLWDEHIKEEKEKEKIQNLNMKIWLEQEEQAKALKQKALEDSFYQKLADGFDVNILIIGDSIGNGVGALTDGEKWFNQIRSHLRKNYSRKVRLKNISVGGSTSYAGYVRTMALDDGVDYDLAIICYGQNDGVDGFFTNYEAIIRAVQTKYPSCSIISILESSQRDYTKKMKEIQDICAHYKISIADTINAFNNSGVPYDELCVDGVHPNSAGQDIYFETIKSVIDENVKKSTGKPENKSIINDDAHKFDNFRWFGTDQGGFERINDTTYLLSISASGVLGIEYAVKSENDKVDIYIDGNLLKSYTNTMNYDFTQRNIMVVDENCNVNREIQIVFDSKEQADRFYGMCFSWR